MKGGKAQSYPQYEDEDKQEAARFLCSDFTNVKSDGDDLRAHPVIRGIEDMDRLNAWTEVAKDLEKGPARRHLRQRRQALTGDDVEVDEAFTPATEIGAQQAVADGGAVVEEQDEEEDEDESDDGDEWEPCEGQAVLEYGTDEEYQSELRSARGLAERYDEIEKVEAALEREQDRDEWRPHVAQALTERLEVLEQ